MSFSVITGEHACSPVYSRGFQKLGCRNCTRPAEHADFFSSQHTDFASDVTMPFVFTMALHNGKVSLKIVFTHVIATLEACSIESEAASVRNNESYALIDDFDCQ